MNIKEYEQIQPNIVYSLQTAPPTTLTFLTPNAHCAWRVETLDTKEPDTIAWLSRMQPGETLFDVGANMGQYALIAAKKGLTVHAFEPESQNFALLCRNIAINNLGELVTPWPLALTNAPSLDVFHVTSLMTGGSCNSYGDAVNYHLQPKQFAFKQGSMGVTLDDFTDRFGMPTHIKIDVDGFEHRVIEGAGAALTHVTSVLIEINTALPEHMRLYDVMHDYGLEPDVATADIARRREGPFAGIGNVIFYRKRAAE
jgi:FkbM family methyltransferase